jgi:hypothetical protein
MTEFEAREGMMGTFAFPENQAVSTDVERSAHWLSSRVEAMRTAAEKRAGAVGDVPEFLAAYENKMREHSYAVSAQLRQDADRGLEAVRSVLRESPSAGDADPRLRPLLRKLRETEARMHMRVIEGVLVPYLFASTDAKTLATALRDGMEHPRSLMAVAFFQQCALKNDLPVPSPNDVLRPCVPGPLQSGLDRLASAAVPEALAEEADRVRQQSANGYFREAAARARRMAARPEAAAFVRELTSFAEALDAEERAETERIEHAFRLQGELYEAVAAAHPERRDELERRRALEDLLAHGEPVGEPVPLFPGAGSGSPHKLALRLGDRTVTALVKFSHAERFVRSGVMPGQGHWREVAGAAHSVGFGVDVPAVAVRRLEGYGTVTVMELIDGSSCSAAPGWFLDRHARGIRPEIPVVALGDYLMGRNDGAPRNLIKTPDGRLVSIDYGSEFSDSDEEPLSSAAWYLMAASRQSVPPALRERVAAWRSSTERQAFEYLLSLVPGQTSAYKKSYEGRLGRLVGSFRATDADAPYPPYAGGSSLDFGSNFLKDTESFFRSMGDTTVVMSDV